MCTNCNDTKEVRLRNDLGQVYAIHKCPICICKLCGGDGVIGNWARDCPVCSPWRFSAHVSAYYKHHMPILKFKVTPGAPIVLGDRFETMSIEPEPTTFQRFINWIKSL